MATSFNEYTKALMRKYAVGGAQQGMAQEYGDFVNLTNTQAIEYLTQLKARSPFLNSIRMQPVIQAINKKLFGSEVYNEVTGRQADRRHIGVMEESVQRYETQPTTSGIFISWGLYDQFAAYGNQLEQYVDEYNQTQIALDMLQIGWYGKKAAQSTTAADLSDVNMGWIAELAAARPQGFKTTGEKVSGEIRIFGENADYKNLNELAIALRGMLEPRYQQRNDLVFLVGSELIAAENGAIMQKPTESEYPELDAVHLMNTFGGLRTIIPPNFPSRGAIVTSLKNLSIYTLANSLRLSMKDEDNLKGYTCSLYRQECYVVEKVGMMSALDFQKVKINGK